MSTLNHQPFAQVAINPEFFARTFTPFSWCSANLRAVVRREVGCDITSEPPGYLLVARIGDWVVVGIALSN
jgi:hypothetical protein